MNNIETAVEELNGKIWKKGDIIRVYLKPSFKRNQKVFIEFDKILEAGEFESFMDGACLQVFTSVQSQSHSWNVNASKQCKHGWMKRIAEITGQDVCETWQEVIII